MSDIPVPMAKWYASLPNKYCGTLYAKIKPPFFPFGFWFEVPIWGQVADGRAHEDAVENFLYNEFPFHGWGWTHVAWKNKPDNPEANDRPRYGRINNPKTFWNYTRIERKIG